MDLVMPRLDGVARDARAARAGPERARDRADELPRRGQRCCPRCARARPATCSRTRQPQELARAVRAAHAGEALLDPAVAARLVEALAARRRRAARRLTPREREVLVLIGRGFPNKRIARELGIAEKTVKTHVGHVLAKLGVADRTQAAVVAVRAGLVERQVLGPIDVWRLRPAPLVRVDGMPIGNRHRSLARPRPRAHARARRARLARRRRRARRGRARRGVGPASTASSRSPATSPTPRTAARSSRPPARGSTCSSTTRASLGPSPLPALADYPLDELRASTRSTCSRRSRSSSSRCRGSRPARAILNVTSDAAVEPYEGWGGYGSSKAALEQLTAILGAEHPELRVYAVDPGDMRTQMHQDAFPGEDISDRPPPEESVPGLLG